MTNIYVLLKKFTPTRTPTRTFMRPAAKSICLPGLPTPQRMVREFLVELKIEKISTPLQLLHFTAFVTRTYIGGGGNSNSSNSSLMAMKIQHRKNGNSKSQLSLFQNSGSLSSLHETALTSDAEEVRSSVSAYQPISHKRSSRR